MVPMAISASIAATGNESREAWEPSRPRQALIINNGLILEVHANFNMVIFEALNLTKIN